MDTDFSENLKVQVKYEPPIITALGSKTDNNPLRTFESERM